MDAQCLRDTKRYLLRAPLSEGNDWTSKVSSSATERSRILQAGAPCQVPAGSFRHCVQVESLSRMDASTTLVSSSTYAEGVSLVRLEVSVERANGERIPQTLMELASYQLKPPSGGFSASGSGPFS